MVYIVKYNMFLFLDYTGFGFEILDQKKFEMKNLKMTCLTYLVIFHLKLIVDQNVNLSHTYGHCLQNHPFVI